MNTALPHARPIGAVLCLCAALSACTPLIESRSAPVSYYLLSPTASGATATADRGTVYAVAPVRVPDYLQQRPIVTRSGDNQIRVADNDQWAAPLGESIRGVVAENLAAMIPTGQVVQLPAPPATPIDDTVFIEIVRFERQPDGAVELVARWSVFGDGGRTLLAIRTGTYRAPDVTSDFPSIVSAMSTLLADLSRDIAMVLRTAPASTTRAPAA